MSKIQCPICFKWFKKIESHTDCKRIKPRMSTIGERFRSMNESIDKTTDVLPQGYGDELALGFAMLNDEYED